MNALTSHLTRPQFRVNNPNSSGQIFSSTMDSGGIQAILEEKHFSVVMLDSLPWSSSQAPSVGSFRREFFGEATVGLSFEPHLSWCRVNNKVGRNFRRRKKDSRWRGRSRTVSLIGDLSVSVFEDRSRSRGGFGLKEVLIAALAWKGLSSQDTGTMDGNRGSLGESILPSKARGNNLGLQVYGYHSSISGLWLSISSS